MKESEEKKSAAMDYPCSWSYQIIGGDEAGLHRVVREIVQDRTYQLILSRSSETGKYQSYRLNLVVESEGHRLAVYEALRAHPAIKIVL